MTNNELTISQDYSTKSLVNPWRGFVGFISHPTWWALPLLATAIVGLVILTVVAGVIWWWYPVSTGSAAWLV